MADIYLISQLPSLDGLNENIPAPITEERFSELCERFLGKNVLRKIEELTLVPTLSGEKTGSSFIDEWNKAEKCLRLALGKVRAEKMNKFFEVQDDLLSDELIKIARDAVEIENPLEAENFLLKYRLDFLESLRPMDMFSENYIYYYGLKLKLILRKQKFDSQLGEVEYKNIYNSILNGDSLEAIQ